VSYIKITNKPTGSVNRQLSDKTMTLYNAVTCLVEVCTIKYLHAQLKNPVRAVYDKLITKKMKPN
jgi:ribosomal protein L17